MNLSADVVECTQTLNIVPRFYTAEQRVTLVRRHKTRRQLAKFRKLEPLASGLLLVNSIRYLESEHHAPRRRSKLRVDTGAGAHLETH